MTVQADSRGERLPVLMYHAVADPGSGSGEADPHYTVANAAFRQHLRIIEAAGLETVAVAPLLTGPPKKACVALTFDDGHASNRFVADQLAAMSWQAEFFVNPSTVGTSGYLSWSDLRAMAEAGMSIQSHGQRHRYLDELPPHEVRAELSDSKRAIEDRLGTAVTVFAPPGGRMPARLGDEAQRAGYAALCTSRVGVWSAASGPWRIPRMAVLSSTSDARFARWIAMNWREVAAQRGRHLSLGAAKWLLGNRGYERVRLGLLRGNF